MELYEFISSSAFLLFVAFIVTTLTKKLNLGITLGFLITGIIISPYSPGPYLTNDVESLRNFTELGIIFLMFLIGLEMKPKNLWHIKLYVFGLGGLQITLTGLAISLLLHFFSISVRESIIIGFALSLSSTAFCMQFLQTKNRMNQAYGKKTFAILIMQDLATVPMLAIIPILSDVGNLSENVSIITQILIVATTLASVIVFAKYIIPILLNRLTNKKSYESFVLVVFLIVFSAAWVTHRIGLSAALGTFLVGMLLASSEHSWKIYSIIEPYKKLLMSLFFISVGMSMDLKIIVDNPIIFLSFTLFVVFIKIVVLFILAKFLFKLTNHVSFKVSFLLSQCGEFGFVILGSAKLLQIINEYTFAVSICVISISMATTPLLIGLGDFLNKKSNKRPIFSKLFNN